jgi:hypothetical protein
MSERLAGTAKYLAVKLAKTKLRAHEQKTIRLEVTR